MQRVIITSASSGIGAALARHYAQRGAARIKVITICPGFIATPMTAKNPYPMPFLLSAETAARKIVGIVERGETFAVIPWQMAIVARVLLALPNSLYDRLFGNAPRKPRGT